MGSSEADDIKYGLMGAFGYLGSNDINVIDDEVIFVPETDNYKEFLKYMNKLYSEGLLDQETFTQDAQQLNVSRSEEHTSELQSRGHLVCRLLLEKKNHEHQK